MNVDTVQEYIRDTIAADTYFTAIDGQIISAIRGDIASTIAKVVAGAKGMSIVIEPGELIPLYSAGTVNCDLSFEIVVAENPTVNRATGAYGKTATAVCAKIVHIFKAGSGQVICCTRIEPIETTGKLLVYAITAKARGTLDEPTSPEETP
jgi:hypothetical protein